MGCSLDAYRLRIGIFNLGKQIKLNIKIKSSKNINNNNNTNPIRLLILILILSTIIANSHYTTRKLHNKTEHTKNGNHTLKLKH